jgi:hypothetical protein
LSEAIITNGFDRLFVQRFTADSLGNTKIQDLKDFDASVFPQAPDYPNKAVFIYTGGKFTASVVKTGGNLPLMLLTPAGKFSDSIVARWQICYHYQ